LAKATKGLVKIAYWDSEQQGPRPPVLGEIKGTPTIRLYKPKKKQKPGSNKAKAVIDYNYERKAIDMKRFVDQHMPNVAEPIVNGLKEYLSFDEKANKYGLPQALLFTSKADTMPLTKYLSTEFRRRLLLAEVKPTKNNKPIMDQFNVTDLPVLIVIPFGVDVVDDDDDVENMNHQNNTVMDDSVNNKEEKEDVAEEVIRQGPIRYDGEGFTKNKLQNFLSKYALKKIVLPAPKKKEETKPPESESESEPKSKVKVEL